MHRLLHDYTHCALHRAGPCHSSQSILTHLLSRQEQPKGLQLLQLCANDELEQMVCVHTRIRGWIGEGRPLLLHVLRVIWLMSLHGGGCEAAGGGTQSSAGMPPSGPHLPGAWGEVGRGARVRAQNLQVK